MTTAEIHGRTVVTAAHDGRQPAGVSVAAGATGATTSSNGVQPGGATSGAAGSSDDRVEGLELGELGAERQVQAGVRAGVEHEDRPVDVRREGVRLGDAGRRRR